MSKKKPKSKVFDAQLFKRLLHYIKPYTGFFILALTTVIGLAVFGALRPKVLQLAIDQNIEQKFEPGFLTYMLLMLGLLVLEVTCRTLKEFRAIIDSKNRSNAGTSAPAHGLYLINIEYPKSIYVQ